MQAEPLTQAYQQQQGELGAAASSRKCDRNPPNFPLAQLESLTQAYQQQQGELEALRAEAADKDAQLAALQVHNSF